MNTNFFFWIFGMTLGVVFFLSIPFCNAEGKNSTGLPLKIPSGFSISYFAKNLKNPRVMIFDPAGNMLVSIPSQGKVIGLADKNNDGIADVKFTVAKNLSQPHGLLLDCGSKRCTLFIAETNKVTSYQYVKRKKGYVTTSKKTILSLPSGWGHFTRTLQRATDGRILVSVGSSCNVCDEKDWRRAKIISFKKNGSNAKVFASGLRNTVFMTTHPATGQIWATEMGRDYLGDDLPPDEINIIQESKHYGWPICYGKNIHDTQFDEKTYIRNPCTEPFEMPSFLDIPAHSAPLGLTFVSASEWPEEYQYNLLVTYHGSWNRSVPTGYKIVRYILSKDGTYQGEEDFITGWLSTDSTVYGRPAGMVFGMGGALFVSDDNLGFIYRIAPLK